MNTDLRIRCVLLATGLGLTLSSMAGPPLHVQPRIQIHVPPHGNALFKDHFGKPRSLVEYIELVEESERKRARAEGLSKYQRAPLSRDAVSVEAWILETRRALMDETDVRNAEQLRRSANTVGCMDPNGNWRPSNDFYCLDRLERCKGVYFPAQIDTASGRATAYGDPYCFSQRFGTQQEAPTFEILRHPSGQVYVMPAN